MTPAQQLQVLPMHGGLMVLALASAYLTVLAMRALGQSRAQRRRAPLSADQQLRHDLAMSVGMIAVGWLATCLSLLLNPILGADEVMVAYVGSGSIALYSVSRGCCMLAFWQVVGLSAFLMRQGRA
jgi:hypothetical protein